MPAFSWVHDRRLADPLRGLAQRTQAHQEQDDLGEDDRFGRCPLRLSRRGGGAGLGTSMSNKAATYAPRPTKCAEAITRRRGVLIVNQPSRHRAGASGCRAFSQHSAGRTLCPVSTAASQNGFVARRALLPLHWHPAGLHARPWRRLAGVSGLDRKWLWSCHQFGFRRRMEQCMPFGHRRPRQPLPAATAAQLRLSGTILGQPIR
jgi:hypothetical protein